MHHVSISQFSAPVKTLVAMARATSIAMVALCATTAVHAWPQFLSMVPNGAVVEFNVVDLGHREGNLLRNQFGLDFNVERNWTKELCQADSDGDGQTNGQELGDPCCVWKIGGNVTRDTGISNPGNKSSLADPSLWKDIDCTAVLNANQAAAPVAADSAATAGYAIAGVASFVVAAAAVAFN